MKTQGYRFTGRLLMPLLVVAGIALLSACSDASNRSDAAPEAKASIIGASADAQNASARAGADILVSAKDSDGIDDPILQFSISALGVSGDPELTVASANALLVERTRSTKVFRTPSVNQQSTVDFEITVTDADGVSDSDRVSLTILPVTDSDSFLTQAAVTNPRVDQYPLLVALDLAPGEVSASSFEVEVETLIQWQPRLPFDDCQFGKEADLCQMVIATQTFTGEWETGLTRADIDAVPPEEAAFNPTVLVPIPKVNIDDVNRFFEEKNRGKRLELANVSTVRAYHRYRFVRADNNAKLMILDARQSDSGLLDHRYDQAGTGTSLPVYAEAIRARMQTESTLSAQAYYYLLDPLQEVDTLAKWKQLRGFNGQNTGEREFAHALYLNNYDLGFGRDMFIRTDECGNVYSYVDNYPMLELALTKQNNFATVVMEYSPLELAPAGICSSAPKIVKFFAYVPDRKNGGAARMATMNFDGRGEKALPGVCTACHAGNASALIQFVGNHVQTSGTDVESLISALDALSSDEKLSLADLDATFMPFDLDSFLYTDAENPDLVDPFYNRAEVDQSLRQKYSKEAQLDAFRTFNKTAMRTYLDKQATLIDPDPNDGFDPRSRWQAPIDLVNTWYQTFITDLSSLDELDNADFDGSAVLDGWIGNQALYEDVFARNCRACHIQLANTDLNFDTVDEFLHTSEPGSTRLEDIVLRSGTMPLARLTMDRFWVDFDGRESAASKLQTHLNSFGVPGEMVAAYEASTYQPDTLGQVINLEADFLPQIENYQWSMVTDCGSNSFLNGKTSPSASFKVDLSPCNYDVSLDISNGTGSDSITKTIEMDRRPAVEPLITAALDSYVPGDSSITIDIDSQIQGSDRGDNTSSQPLDTIVKDPNTFSKGDGTVNFSFPALGGVNNYNFSYSLEDFNGTPSSTEGNITVNIPAIEPKLIVESVYATAVTLGWGGSVPKGFLADYYALFRDGVFLTELSKYQPHRYQDRGLSSDNTYEYTLATVLGDETYLSPPVVVNTAAIPSISNVAPSGTGALQINWSFAGDSASSFTIYRNGVAVATVADSLRAYVDSGLAPNTRYRYKIGANFEWGDSSDSNEVANYTLPNPPIFLNESTTTSSLTLNWSANSNPAGTVYYICIDGDCPESRTTTFTSFSNTRLSENQENSYEIFARWAGATALTSEAKGSGASTFRTKVSYIGSIEGGPATSRGCIGCHGRALTESRFRTYSCVTDADRSLYDCSFNTPDMNFSFTVSEFELIERWVEDKMP